MAVNGKMVISQTKKPTQRPTLKWVFFLFRRVRAFSVLVDDRYMTKIDNLSPDLRKILALLGLSYEKKYFRLSTRGLEDYWGKNPVLSTEMKSSGFPGFFNVSSSSDRCSRHVSVSGICLKSRKAVFNMLINSPAPEEGADGQGYFMPGPFYGR